MSNNIGWKESFFTGFSPPLAYVTRFEWGKQYGPARDAKTRTRHCYTIAYCDSVIGLFWLFRAVHIAFLFSVSGRMDTSRTLRALAFWILQTDSVFSDPHISFDGVSPTDFMRADRNFLYTHFLYHLRTATAWNLFPEYFRVIHFPCVANATTHELKCDVEKCRWNNFQTSKGTRDLSFSTLFWLCENRSWMGKQIWHPFSTSLYGYTAVTIFCSAQSK